MEVDSLDSKPDFWTSVFLRIYFQGSRLELQVSSFECQYTQTFCWDSSIDIFKEIIFFLEDRHWPVSIRSMTKIKIITVIIMLLLINMYMCVLIIKMVTYISSLLCLNVLVGLFKETIHKNWLKSNASTKFSTLPKFSLVARWLKLKTQLFQSVHGTSV